MATVRKPLTLRVFGDRISETQRLSDCVPMDICDDVIRYTLNYLDFVSYWRFKLVSRYAAFNLTHYQHGKLFA